MLAAVVLVSFSFPRLADRAERRSTRALVAGDLDKALDEARWAHRFNPVSADPLFAQARVAERQRVPWRAERAYIRAVELQPDNPLTWYTLGIFEFDVRENLCAAYRFLNNSYTLDPAGNQWQRGRPARRRPRRSERGRLRARVLGTENEDDLRAAEILGRACRRAA